MHAPSNFALRSLPDVFSGSSPLSPLHLHSDLQSLREIALFGSPRVLEMAVVGHSSQHPNSGFVGHFRNHSFPT